MVFADPTEVNPRRVRKQHENQGQLGDDVDGFVIDVDVRNAQSGGACDQAESSEHQGRGDHRAFEAPGDEGEAEKQRPENGDAGQVHTDPTIAGSD